MNIARRELLVALPGLLFITVLLVFAVSQPSAPPAAPYAPPGTDTSTAAVPTDTPAGTLRCSHCPQRCALADGDTGACGLFVRLGQAILALRGDTPAARSAARIMYGDIPARDIPALTRAQAVAAGLALHEAAWYDRLAGTRVRCGLCPFRCVLNSGQRGRCSVRLNLDGTLYALTYGKPLSVNVDPVEKKPLFHFQPGSRTFSLATAGCNLGCVFCQNWELSQAFPESARARDVSPEQVVALAEQYGCRSIAYTYSEPTVFFEYMRDTARLARTRGLKNIWITAGFIEPAPLRELCGIIDAANIDVKGFSEQFYRDYCHASLAPVLRTVEACQRAGVWVEITYLVVPGGNDSDEMIGAFCRWLQGVGGGRIPLHFSRFFPNYQLRNQPPTPEAALVHAAELATAAGHQFVYIGNLPGNTWQATRCPRGGEPLLERAGYTVTSQRLQGGHCPAHGDTIPGVWQ
ncbi:MAG TPA: AmmeMemoRadiSam system radical SAM enzyme [bacterium]|nr:AmmeMemoRadiSam system radical SAM enzyme [bacterium]